MKQIRKFEIIVDADDVLLDCNRYALSLLSGQEHHSYSIDAVTGWGLLGIPEDKRLAFLDDRNFYTTQPAFPGARDFLKELCSLANVTIMTAVYPQFMGERIERLTQLFPEFPVENILMGKRKEMLQADIMLDDGVHNLMNTNASLPVLFRQPWNRTVSGICCVNSYRDFLSLVNIMVGNRMDTQKVPKVLCIVGPSGSGKHELADALCEKPDYEQIRTCTTCAHPGKNRAMTEEEFIQAKLHGMFIESTYYCRSQYGLPRADIDSALFRGKNAVAVMDISGCMAVNNAYPGQTVIIYADRDKRGCVRSVLNKKDMSVEDQTDRILSIDMEQKNKILADHIVETPVDANYAKIADAVAAMIP